MPENFCSSNSATLSIINSSTNSLHLLQQMLTNSQCIRNNSERRIHRAAGWKKRSINNVEIICVVRFAIHVEHRIFWIITKPAGAALMR